MAQSVAEFKAYKGKSAQEKLFAQVLETLEQDYGTIFNPQSTHMDIIRWCIRKKFLQQAMTLFNEWIPAEIVRCKIFYPAPEYSHVISVACQKHNLGYELDANVFVYEFYNDRIVLSKFFFGLFPQRLLVSAKFNNFLLDFFNVIVCFFLRFGIVLLDTLQKFIVCNQHYTGFQTCQINDIVDDVFV